MVALSCVAEPVAVLGSHIMSISRGFMVLIGKVCLQEDHTCDC